MCKFLVDNGAEINKKGGDSISTPLQWAAQRCHYYVVHLLLQHGADPLITDAQGYNTLHISTFNGNVLLLVLLLHTGIPVDVLDSFGHTGMMWAAYKGFPSCVDVYLRWGASVHATDEQGFTALHWALVKGSPGCVQKLIEYGADRFAKTETGKTPAITAEELKTLGAWHKALKECGYDEDGHAVTPNFPGASYFLKDRRGFVTKFTFLWPFLCLWAVFVIMAGMPVFAGVPIALIVGYMLQWVALKVLAYAPPDMQQFQRTVCFGDLQIYDNPANNTLAMDGRNFLGFLVLGRLQLAFRCLPKHNFESRCVAPLFLCVGGAASTITDFELPDGDATHWLLNLSLGGFYTLTTWFYYCSMTFDPGFVPKLNGISEQKAVIDELIGLWKYDDSNFCVTCMIRTPLRSKHCRRCQRCIARHDQ